MGGARSLSALWRGERSEQLDWLSLTPEPERELPEVLAALRPGGEAGAERRRLEEVVLRGEERDWLAYLSEAVRLLLGSPQARLGERRRAAALEVLANHHRLLLGIPGSAAERTEAERAALERAIAANGASAGAGGGNPRHNGGP